MIAVGALGGAGASVSSLPTIAVQLIEAYAASTHIAAVERMI